MEIQEMKQIIKDYFVTINEDKFTKVKSIKCKHEIEWKGNVLENKFMFTKGSLLHTLSMGIDYRHKDEIDSVFFEFAYSNSDGGYPGMNNIKMYLIIDEDKTIELSEGSGFDHASRSSKFGNIYIETAQLSVSMSDFIAIANAKKIEYSIRFGQGSLEKVFTQNELLIFKGFYNSAFDDNFDIELIYNSVNGKISQNEIISKFQKIIDDSGYECVETDIDINKFRFGSFHKSPIQLEENENVILATFSNSFNKSLCDVLITNKKLYYFNFLGTKLRTIELKGNLNFEVGKNLLYEKVVEKNCSFSVNLSTDGMAIEIANILNSVVKNNNGQ